MFKRQKPTWMLAGAISHIATAVSFAAGKSAARSGVHPPGQLGVARIWHGRVPNAKASEYADYLYANGITRIRKLPSNLGVQVLRRQVGDFTDFTVISYWPSHESIKEWAGNDVTKARYLDRDKEYLVELEPEVQHHDIIVSEGKTTK
jgi:heme-degrading monooxygenase HmoA